MSAVKLDWRGTILPQAAAIVRRYDTGVTLRQLFYQLVSIEMIPNTLNAYKGLSRYTAEARRDGWFPDLIDPGRRIEEPYPVFSSSLQAVKWVKERYIRNRTENQEVAIYLGVEKLGIVEQLKAWFGDPLGVPVLPLRGYSSQTLVNDVIEHVQDDGRESVFIYAGDFDPSGEDIQRDFLERTDIFDEVIRVALDPAQIQQYNLPPLPGKTYVATDPMVQQGRAKVGDPKDSRSAGFVSTHGVLMQVELDALDADVLRGLYRAAIDRFWDYDVYRDCVAQEKKERGAIDARDPDTFTITRAQAEAIREWQQISNDTPDEAADAVDSLIEQMDEEDED